MLWHIQRFAGVGLFALTVIGSNAYAADCDALKSYREVIGCIAVNAPDIKRSELQLKVADAELDRAAEFRNPELESRTLWGSGNSSTSGVATETQLLFPLQLGGKRSARGQVASAERESAVALAQSARERTLIEAALSLHRLRQIETELYLANEAVERFEKIIKAFGRRPQLNPEQSVSLTTFRYALEEERQKKAQVMAEQSSILTSLSLALGQKIELKKDFLPTIPNKWPSPEVNFAEGSADFKLARAKHKESQAQNELAKAGAWPDLKIGPSYERMPERERTDERIGISLSIELPVFNRNQAGKRSAEFSKSIATLDAELVAKTVNAKLDSLAEQYSLIANALASAPSHTELEKGHRAFESQFTRGLVPYGLIIEAHRQLHSTVETKHKQELMALNLLWSIYKLTGRLTPEVL